MLDDKDYAELKEIVFDYLKESPQPKAFEWWKDLYYPWPVAAKLQRNHTDAEVKAALFSIIQEYDKIQDASIDLAQALCYILGWRPKDWDAEKARDLGRAALTKAGIMIPEPMNQEEYAYYVLVKGFIESGWEYEEDAERQLSKMDIGIIKSFSNLDLDPWNNANWRNAQ